MHEKNSEENMRLVLVSYTYDPPIYDITSGCKVAALFWREAPRWTSDAIWFLPYFNPHDSNSAWYLFRIPMIHRFMTSHPVAKLLLCFGAKHQDGRPMLFGFFLILTHRLTELCIVNAENVEKVYSRPFKQMS